MELQTEALNRYINFVVERHKIYIRKTRHDPWPWTEDPIFQTYKFTNIYRQLDTGTVHATNNIINPYYNHPELFFNITLYRMYNRISTQKFIGFISTDAEAYAVEQRVREYKEAGNKVFTAAHMLTGTMEGDKIHQILGTGLTYLWEHRRELEPKPGDTLEGTFKNILSIPSVGRFVGYEIVTDLRHTRYLDNAPDIMTWCNAGPGAKRGIFRLLGLPVKGKRAPGQYPGNALCLHIIRFLLDFTKPFLPSYMPPWEMREVEHSLCEFDKYERVRNGEGRPRQKYIYSEQV